MRQLRPWRPCRAGARSGAVRRLGDARRRVDGDPHLSVSGHGEEKDAAASAVSEMHDPNPASAEDFAKQKIGGLLCVRDRAIVAAENPRGERASDEADSAAMAQVEANLDHVGVQYEELRGKHGNAKVSRAATRNSQEDEIALGEEFGQGTDFAVRAWNTKSAVHCDFMTSVQKSSLNWTQHRT